MKSPSTNLNNIHRQQGSMLLEALISILIFSLGILAIVGLQATSIKYAGDAKYRTDASLLANELIGQMWADDRTASVLSANYNSPLGSKYLTWSHDVANSLPGASSTPPTISIAQITNLATGEITSLVTVTIQWKAPSETQSHTYKTVAQIF